MNGTKSDLSKQSPPTDLIFLGILILGLALRLIAVTERQVWFDEVHVFIQAKIGLANFLDSTVTTDVVGNASDNHPPGYFAMLWGWMQIFGETTVSGRMFSIAAGTALVGVVYIFGRTAFGNKTARIQALLVAVSPILVHYSQEIRMYMLFAILSILTAFSLWQAMQSQKTIWWAAFSVLAAMAQYTHNLAAFFILSLALIPVIMKDWLSTKKMILAGMGALVLYLPWLMVLPAQLARVQSGFWIPRPGLAEIINTLISTVINLPLEGLLLPVGLSLTMIVIIFAIRVYFQIFPGGGKDASVGGWLLYLTIVPPALLFLFSQFMPVYLVRGTLPSTVMFLMWLGWVVGNPRGSRVYRSVIMGLMAIAAAIGIFVHVTYQGFPYAPYQALGEYLSSQAGKEDVIVHSNKLTILPLFHYYPEMEQEFVADIAGGVSDIFSPNTQAVLGVKESSTVAVAVGGAHRVWFIIFDRAIEEYRAVGEETHPQLEWLEANFITQDVQEWGDILLYQFINPE